MFAKCTGHSYAHHAVSPLPARSSVRFIQLAKGARHEVRRHARFRSRLFGWNVGIEREQIFLGRPLLALLLTLSPKPDES